MVLAYRIARAEFTVFDSGGAKGTPGRWSKPPRAIINCAASYSLALLEVVVHGNLGRPVPDLRFARIEIPTDVACTTADAIRMPGWEANDLAVSQDFGNAWYDVMASAVLIVPSVLSPYESNILINQTHPNFERIRVVDEGPVKFDRRLLR